VQRTTIQWINTAVNKECLADLIDDNTGLLESKIPEILQELFCTWGHITPQSVTRRCQNQSRSHHLQPVKTHCQCLYGNQQGTCTHGGEATETPIHLINSGLIIITGSTIFASDTHKWHSKSAANKTWDNFKTYFKIAQKEMLKSQPMPS
jgi:hypothetical protein